VILLSAYVTTTPVVKPVLFATLTAKGVIHVSFLGPRIGRLMSSYPDVIETTRVIVTRGPRAYDIVRAATGDPPPSAFVTVNDFLFHAGMLPCAATPHWHCGAPTR
jgi:hypothetical protein